MNEDNWDQYFRKPTDDKTVEDRDPYSPDITNFPNEFNGEAVRSSDNDFPYRLINHLQNEGYSCLSLYQNDSGDYRAQLVLIDHKLEEGSNMRSQPVLIEVEYLPEATFKCEHLVYNLILKTPLGNIKNHYSNEQELIQNNELLYAYHNIYPYLKLVKEQGKGEMGGLFKLHLRADLPYIQKGDNVTTSWSELKLCINALMNFGDQMEQYLFRDQDLSKQDLEGKLNKKEIDLNKDFKDLREGKNDVASAALKNWENDERAGCLIRKRETDKIEHSILEQNGITPFVKYQKGNKNKLEIVQAFPNKDVQDEELRVLEDCYDH
ncbi:MAG: hypothetical protein ABEH43_10320 [Flavobacteriales bacterium]